MQNPKNVDINAIFEYPYFWEDGISSASDIYSIIPQTTAKIIPNIRSLMKGFKHKNAINAPRGSAIPDKKAYFMALYLLLVAKYIGSAIAIPSGMLWSAIAIVTVMPREVSW